MVTKSKWTAAQKRAQNNYRQKHKAHTAYLAKRSTARTFISKYGTIEDVKELQQRIAKRLLAERKKN